MIKFAEEFYEDSTTKTKINNLYDYGDNTMRYFRLTRFFGISTNQLGQYWEIDTSKSRAVEIEELINTYDGSSFKFSLLNDYLAYLSDISKPELPWEKTEKLLEIAQTLKDSILKTVESNKIKLNATEQSNIFVDFDKLNKEELENEIKILRQINLSVKEKINKAWELIYIAEGSDWNWWYGDDHSSKNDAEFDNLYRTHLMGVYKIIGLQIPPALFEPIQKGPQAFEMLPTNFITPVIDGEDTGFFEWRGAGVYDLLKEGGVMHKTDKYFEKLYYGFNFDNFYIRLDKNDSFDKSKKQKLSFLIKFFDGEKDEFIKFDLSNNSIETYGIDSKDIVFKMNKIIEICIPFKIISHLTEGKDVKCNISILADNNEIQRMPEKGIIRIRIPDGDFLLYN